MRIAQVVTFDSSDGAFGGPTRVAHGHAKALAARGHDVTVFAASPRGEQGVLEVDGYTVRKSVGRRLAGGRSFASMASWGLTRTFVREVRSFDVVHIHFARDLVTIPAALISRARGTPYVLQPHGMLRKAEGPLLRLFDSLGTRRAMRGSAAVLALTSDETAQVTALTQGQRVRLIANGVEVAPVDNYSLRRPLVVFVARLHKRKRPVAFVEMAQRVAREHPDVQFVLVGPDEGEAAAVNEAIRVAGLASRVEWIGGVDAGSAEDWIASAKVLVLPSVGEVFPMTMLEAFRRGTPVVATESLGIAAESRKRGAAVITDGAATSMAAAVLSILASAEIAERLRTGSREYVLDKLNIASVAHELEGEYVTANAGRSRR